MLRMTRLQAIVQRQIELGHSQGLSIPIIYSTLSQRNTGKSDWESFLLTYVDLLLTVKPHKDPDPV